MLGGSWLEEIKECYGMVKGARWDLVLKPCFRECFLQRVSYLLEPKLNKYLQKDWCLEAAAAMRTLPGAFLFFTIVIWLILPVVICLSQRLSHACLSISNLYSETANGSLNQLSFI